MVVNFRTSNINQNTCKLDQTLKKKKFPFSYISFPAVFNGWFLFYYEIDVT
jgi:hypothetical protein